MRRRAISTRHSRIFEYWKDKAITRDGKVVLRDSRFDIAQTNQLFNF